MVPKVHYTGLHTACSTAKVYVYNLQYIKDVLVLPTEQEIIIIITNVY